jgi:hypothetical protein
VTVHSHKGGALNLWVSHHALLFVVVVVVVVVIIIIIIIINLFTYFLQLYLILTGSTQLYDCSCFSKHLPYSISLKITS